MTSKTSYNNLGRNVRDQLHSMRSFILLLAVVYLACGPLWVFLQLTSYSGLDSVALTNLTTIYVGYFTPFYWLALGLGAVGGLYVTRYQDVPQQSNFYHSLPVTRAGLLSARVLALLLVQVLLLIVVTMVDVVFAVMIAGNIDSALVMNLVLSCGVHFCYIMLVFLTSLAVVLLAGQLTANTVGQVLMSVVIHLTIPLTAVVLSAVVSISCQTYSTIGLFDTLTRFNIITGFTRAQTSVYAHINTLNPALEQALDAANFSPHFLAWPLVMTLLYVLVAVVCFVLTYVLYARRAVEKAGDTLMYPLVGSIVKAIYVFLGGVFCGLGLRELAGETMIGFVIGAIVGMVVVHLIAEMLFSMDVDGVRRHYVSSLVGLVVALVATLGFQSGLIDMDSRFPDAASVKGAYIGYVEDNGHYGDNVAAVEDVETVAKMVDAAEKLGEANVVFEPLDDAQPDLITIDFSYRTTLGGITTRRFNVEPETARKIMQPLLDDSEVTRANWSSLANADVTDLVECAYSRAFSDYVGGYDTYLIESSSPYGNSSGLVKDTEDGARRAEALLKAIQSDMDKRSFDTYQGRVIGTFTYSVLSTDSNGADNINWGLRYTLYEGDAATSALLAQWREEGFLADERDTFNDMLKGYEATVYMPASDDNDESVDLATLTTEQFVDAYVNGALVSDKQARLYGVPVESDVAVGLCDGTVSDPDSAIIAVYYYRAGAEVPTMNTEGNP